MFSLGSADVRRSSGKFCEKICTPETIAELVRWWAQQSGWVRYREAGGRGFGCYMLYLISFSIEEWGGPRIIKIREKGKGTRINNKTSQERIWVLYASYILECTYSCSVFPCTFSFVPINRYLRHVNVYKKPLIINSINTLFLIEPICS